MQLRQVVAKYLDIFERMYLIYRLSPFSSNKLRALKKDQKHYHYNWAEVPEPGARFENLIAGHLLKWIHFQQDYAGEDMELRYFRDSEKREVDFIVTQGNKPIMAIECKTQHKDIATALKYLKSKFPRMDCIQVHLKIDREYQSQEGIQCLGWKTLLDRLI